MRYIALLVIIIIISGCDISSWSRHAGLLPSIIEIKGGEVCSPQEDLSKEFIT